MDNKDKLAKNKNDCRKRDGRKKFKPNHWPLSRQDNQEIKKEENTINENSLNLYYHLKRLQDLSSMDSDNALAIIASKEDEFKKLINCNLKSDYLVITVRVLTNICEANFTDTITKVLSQICFSNFLTTLDNFIVNLPFEDLTKRLNIFYHEDINRFWFNLVSLFEKIIELIPNTASDKLTPILQKVHLVITRIEITEKYEIDIKIKTKVLNMIENLKEKIQTFEEKNVKILNNISKESPPEDFRMLSIFPTIVDLFNKNPYLRPSIVDKAYDSSNHYLDIHFRLLREDFIRPLRNGIQQYLNENQVNRNHDFRIYRNVKLVEFEIKEKYVGIKLCFGKLKFPVNWNHSKRFMFGGLLLLSKDNFKTIIFATVVNRDIKSLAEGYVSIEPCEGIDITTDDYNSTYVLLESKIYFEPYYVVLNAMKNIDDNNFPMKRYLIEADTSTKLPEYLSHEPVLYNDEFRLPTAPLNSIFKWPSAMQLGLDESQFNAFKSAITQEFSILQGPPGTGKTFLALKIVHTLLTNKIHWKKYGPIIVVCLTNHALDQFLEGILKYTKSIARVGSRSKNESLANYSLMNIRKSSNRSNPARSLVYKNKIEVEEILRTINKLRLCIQYLSMDNIIVPLFCFYKRNEDFNCQKFKNSADLITWLIDFNIIDIRKPLQVQQTMNSIENIPDETLYEDDHRHTDADLELDHKKFKTHNVEKPTFILKVFDDQIVSINNLITNIRSEPITNSSLTQLSTLERHREVLINKRKFTELELSRHPIKHPNRFTKHYRWNKYWKWVKYNYDSITKEILRLEMKYRRAIKELRDATNLADLELLKYKDVVGLTTTCAAKIQSSLRALRAPIVLVEEAAEILEAHILCSMTKHCQHLILIGDHKQLKPKASVYELGAKCNLNVSLFERMVNIRGGECPQLTYQHRMRPEIADLITPSIYTKLCNHESVLNYSNVKGVEKNLFFLNHSNYEESYNNEESWVNKHEVQFFIAFAKYLLMQGYKSSEITILCTYTGQLFSFMTEKSRHALLKEVRITTVDNFQGEENKIILLSLVRNNGNGKVGFLMEENRVCVALSRAREGLFIMGNMQDLLAKQNIWHKINETLEKNDAIGDHLILKCQLHSDQIFEIKTVDDFKQCPEGGCLKKCNSLLNCGHICTSICHVLDREHTQFKCQQNCNNSCSNKHPCPQKCFEICSPCKVRVEKQLRCGHTVEILCSTDPSTFSCTVEIDATLDCNHNVKKPCYLPLNKCKCTHDCEIRLPCGHSCLGKCHFQSDPDHLKYNCTKDCTKKNIDCTKDHYCTKRCFEPCISCPVLVNKKRSCGHHHSIKCSSNIEDVSCSKLVTKQSSCGHTFKVNCCEEATPSKCNGRCPKKLPCGHPCTKKCKEPCTTVCYFRVNLSQPGLCGHIFSVPCYLQCSDSKSATLLQYCQEPCKTLLACSHICKGNCGSCLQGRIHVPCSEQCRNIFVCGHNCKILCNQECQPCVEKCTYKCVHSKCNKKCGQPCTPCKEKCELNCEHRRCSKRCYEICDVEPCSEPCKKKLKCNHECVGYCGDPCPPLCRQCNKDDLTEIFFGTEDEPDARFVLLTDCGHCFESTGFMQWIASSKNENSDESISIKTCPKCKTPIKNCRRIINQLKQNLKDIMTLKSNLFFKNKQLLAQKKNKCYQKLKNIKFDGALKEFSALENYVRHIEFFGYSVKNNRKVILNYNEVDAFENIFKLLNEIIEVLRAIKSFKNSYEFIKVQVNLIVNYLPKNLQISNQRLLDLQLELRRLHIMVKVYNLFLEHGHTSASEADYNLLLKKLSTIEKFDESVEKEILSLSSAKLNLSIDRQMVVKAIGLGKGHWFKCPNGHFYAIGECGGPQQRGKCIECGATIGGQQHRLDASNSFAPEIDNAVQPSWPTTLMR